MQRPTSVSVCKVTEKIKHEPDTLRSQSNFKKRKRSISRTQNVLFFPSFLLCLFLFLVSSCLFIFLNFNFSLQCLSFLSYRAFSFSLYSSPSFPFVCFSLSALTCLLSFQLTIFKFLPDAYAVGYLRRQRDQSRSRTQTHTHTRVATAV